MTEQDDRATRRRPGRPPGSTSTRRTVLDAASRRFASDGFAATTIRRIAADAQVDASLVMQFYGSKEQLFAAVMEIPPSALEQFSTAFDGADEKLGERVARAFLGAWEESSEASEPLMAMLRGAIAHDAAREQLREFIQSRLLDGACGAGDDDTALRAGLASAMLVGVIMNRRIIAVPTLEEADVEDLVSALAPAIQSVLVPGTSSRRPQTSGERDGRSEKSAKG